MESNGAINFRHRRSPSSDRFLEIFSSSPSETAAFGDELNEDDVFWTGDFAEPSRLSESPSGGRNSQTFCRSEGFGILAALPEDNRRQSRPVLYRKPSVPSSSTTTSSSSRIIPSIPKPPAEREYSQSVPSRKFHQSAPMNVPIYQKKINSTKLDEMEDKEDEEMLPPHEIVARGSAFSPKTTFSVLEGVGRTLKGRDLRQVRNAVWRQTGFLD